MVTPLFVENRIGILFRGSTVHIRNRTTDFWRASSLVHVYWKSDDDDMMMVLSNLLVRAPKIPGPAGGKQENFVVMYTSYAAHK